MGALKATPTMGQANPTRVRVTCPATTANLGPGFDALGLARGLHNATAGLSPDATAGLSPSLAAPHDHGPITENHGGGGSGWGH